MFLFFYPPPPPQKKMKDKIAALKTKLEDLDEKILGLHIQHSSMNNRRQPKSSTDNSFSYSNNFRGSNLDFPCFNGDDPTGWIYRAEQYFNLHNTFDVHQVPLASFHLEQEALQWYCWYIKAHEEPKWPAFCQLFLHRFGPVLLMTSQELSLNFAKLAL